ncbi:alpha/beta fold family hydrolase [Nitzschia inconspicua]|uniref:Alpha/beta fold family hydrolase n=1 Tax=Nitzschia inconspicua TaxID=303405 RepID=A0A9K3M1L3_9STRA|nr:alpha/beta fold family hydrolase [Nitzschia inconspicua]
MEGITLTCSDGIELHGQRWRKRKRRRRTVDEEFTVNVDLPYATNCKDHSTPPTTRRLRILCLHGFLDNCRSHYLLGPNLVTHLTDEKNDNNDNADGDEVDVDVDVVAIDLPGHGWSSHKSRDVPASWLVSDYCYYIAEAVTRLGWTTVGNENQTIQQQQQQQQRPLPRNNDESFVLIGHSFGGAISIEYAATFPEQVQALILLDAHGPDYDNPDRISARIRNHVLDRYHYNEKTNNAKDDDNNNNKNINNVVTTKQYSDLRAAVQTRMDTARFSPGGRQWLSQEAATEMVQRATCFAGDGTVQFVHDVRLKHSPLLLPTLDHVLACWNNLTCPVYCLYAKDGWPFYPLDIQRAHDQLSNNNSNTNLVVETFPGSHHFHADPDTAPRVVEAIVRFLQRQGL